MATCKQVLDALTEYLEGDLEAAAEKDFDVHMEGCIPCDAFFRTYRKSAELAHEMLQIHDVPPELQARVRAFLRARLGITP